MTILKQMEGRDYFDGQFWVGSNYWPAHAGIHMWSDWRPDLVQGELTRMADLGFTVNRSFLFMPDFMPTPAGVKPVMLERFLEFLDLNDGAGIRTIPSFIVGHMSGEDWDVPWREKRNFYTDRKLLDIQKLYIQTIVNSTLDSKAVAGWIATNEVFNYEPNGTADEIAEWGRTITGFIKELDPERPVSLGEGARGPETNRRLKNFTTRKYVSFIDFIGLHFYPRPGNHWHQSFTTAFRVNISQFWKKPVIIEEFGHSTTMGSEKNQADYYRTVLYSGLINGAVGAMNWCYTDFELFSTRPYSHHPFELRFGLVKTNGELRPAGTVMSEFSRLAVELAASSWQRIALPEIGLQVPSNYFYEYPHDYDTLFPHWYQLYLDVFSQLKRINLNPRLLLEPAIELENAGKLSHELELDPQRHPVLLLPRLKRITGIFWQKIIKYVENGGNLYVSFAEDAWIPDWEEYFGIKSDLYFGVPAMREWDNLRITPTREWGDFKISDVFELRLTARENYDNAYCPLISTEGEVLLVDQAHHPVLIRKQLGQGRIYFAVYPLEMIGLANGSDDSDRLLQKLYGTIWKEHGAHSDIEFQGQDLEMGIWRHAESGRLKVVILNHARENRKGRLVMPYRITNSRFPDGASLKSPHEMEFLLSSQNVLVLDFEASG
ncbi:MAG: hypothetical protein ABIA75_08245 [Candidatus Neomarinimicrobiota bacterium]